MRRCLLGDCVRARVRGCVIISFFTWLEATKLEGESQSPCFLLAFFSLEPLAVNLKLRRGGCGWPNNLLRTQLRKELVCVVLCVLPIHSIITKRKIAVDTHIYSYPTIQVAIPESNYKTSLNFSRNLLMLKVRFWF